jgi:2-dehydropantoate 2-reductase
LNSDAWSSGAIGSHMAAWLARAGTEVSILARGAGLETIRRDGLRFESEQESFAVHLRVSDAAATLGPQDLLIVEVKANGLRAVAAAMEPLLGAETGASPWTWTS